jgi:hypothetical protein
MYKNFKNDDAVSGAVAILMLIIAYLFVTAIVISFCLTQGFGINNDVPILPSQGDIKAYSNNQNFSSGDFNWELAGVDLNSKWVNQTDVGMVLTQLGSHTFSYFGIDYLQKDTKNEYDNTYLVNNSATNIFGGHNDYCVILRYTGGTDQNEVCVRDDGFYIPTYSLNADYYTGYNFYQTYPEAHNIENVKIRTVYNDKDLRLDFYLNDNLLFVTTRLNPESGNTFTQSRYYAGVGSNILGFALTSFDTQNTIISGKNNDVTLWSLTDILFTIVKILLWQLPNGFLPIELVAILIGLPEGIGIACVIFIVIRGVD